MQKRIVKTGRSPLVVCVLTVAFCVALCLQSDAGDATEEIESVPCVDVSRFMGDWYEIARYLSFFEKNCVAVRSQCELRKDGKITIINYYKKKKFDAPQETAKSRAWFTDQDTNAKLKVQFFWPFYTRHWIIDLDKDYRYAVIGHPDRDSLWIMSRTPAMDEATYNQILARLDACGYDIGKIEKTLQPSGPLPE